MKTNELSVYECKIELGINAVDTYHAELIAKAISHCIYTLDNSVVYSVVRVGHDIGTKEQT